MRRFTIVSLWAGTIAAMDIEVTRSERRKKTVQARLRGGVLHIAIPAHLTTAQEAEWVERMRRRFVDRRDADRIDLAGRARTLAAELGLPPPDGIVWSDRQTTLWGSCTVASRRIRIARRVATFPAWVLDYVIVHELAHLVVPRHDEAFWDLVGRYRLTERARGYLIAKGEEGH